MRQILYQLFALISLGILAACTGASVAGEQPTASPIPITPAAAKIHFTVERGDILSQIQFSARVIPKIEEQLYFRTDGRIRRIYVRPGDTITQGQVLADLMQLNQMEAQERQQALDLRRAQINLEMAQLRQEAMKTQTPNWELNYDITMRMQALEVELAQISLDETQLASGNLDTAIEDAQIVSPIEGKVLQIQAREGTEISAYKVMMVVGDDSQIEIGADLTTDMMRLLTEGMPTTIEPAMHPGELLPGRVSSLPYPFGTGGESAQPNSNSSTDTTTRISLDDPDQLSTHKLGDIVTVTVTLEKKPDVLWLPPQAIRMYEGRYFVVVQTDGLARRVDVRLGVKSDDRVEILAGLEEGQVVISP